MVVGDPCAGGGVGLLLDRVLQSGLGHLPYAIDDEVLDGRLHDSLEALPEVLFAGVEGYGVELRGKREVFFHFVGVQGGGGLLGRADVLGFAASQVKALRK